MKFWMICRDIYPSHKQTEKYVRLRQRRTAYFGKHKIELPDCRQNFFYPKIFTLIYIEALIVQLLHSFVEDFFGLFHISFGFRKGFAVRRILMSTHVATLRMSASEEWLLGESLERDTIYRQSCTYRVV